MLDEKTMMAVSRRGKSIVERKEGELLEKGFAGMYAAIEPDSEEIYTGATSLEALKSAEQSHPGKIFYIAQIGKKVSVLLRRS